MPDATPAPLMPIEEYRNEQAGSPAGVLFRAPDCLKCRHKFESSACCAAYPQGIPAPVIQGLEPHRVPREGDGGIVFEPA